MMLKVLPLTALALGLSGGVALADHGRGGDHRGVTVEHRAAPQTRVEVRDRPGWHGGGNVVVRDHRGWNGGGRVIVRNEPRYHRVVRRPIYISRPVIHERYFNYYRRPAIIVENYNAMPGYYWVAGSWTWDGSEWAWQPGHYEPDPNYVDSAYDSY
jgi:WXXGXW repeat (2 copies)